MRSRLVWILLAVAAVACDGGADPIPPGETTVAPQATVDGITAQQIDGTWVFTNRPNGGSEALHTGFPNITDGCLYVGQAIVIWPEAMAAAMAEALTAASDGGGLEPMRLGGGGISIEEGGAGAIPSIVADRCAVTEVWFASSWAP